jgi:acid phosphatase
MILNDKTYDGKAWSQFVASQMSAAIPGAVEFTQYADAKGVKVFYVTNRAAADEEPTRQNMQKLGFPMGGNVDTFLMQGEKPDWGSAKGTRRAVIAKDYRVLLCLGDNFGDFVDAYKGSEADRQTVYDANKARWGRSWIMIANPSYGSFESAPFLGDYSKPIAVQRQAKRDVLTAWPGPK